MKVYIQELSFQATDKLLDFTKEKVKSLLQFDAEITEAHVTLKVERSRTKHDRFCQIRLSIPGNDVIASKISQSFEESILKACEALKQPLLSKKQPFKGAAMQL